MIRSENMQEIIDKGFVYVDSMEEILDIQDESVFEGILIDYSVSFRTETDENGYIVHENKKCYRVYQVGE